MLCGDDLESASETGISALLTIPCGKYFPARMAPENELPAPRECTAPADFSVQASAAVSRRRWYPR
jgi:hypothetical protein